MFLNTEKKEEKYAKRNETPRIFWGEWRKNKIDIYFSLIAFQNPSKSVEIICNNNFAAKINSTRIFAHLIGTKMVNVCIKFSFDCA